MNSPPPVPPEELIERARGLAPLYSEQAAESEKLRRPTDEAMAATEDAEIFKLMVPRCYGGFEFDMDTFVDVVLALSEGDASLAWVTAFLIEHNWMLNLFPESFQKELYADRSYVLAPAMIAPTGLAKPVSGGVVLNGRWQFATGVWHSSWVIAGAIRLNEGEAPDPRFFAIPRAEVRVEDTWQVDGMCGTGSHDVVIEECFVPEARSVSIIEMNQGRAPGSGVHAGPLYRTPMVALLSATAAMPVIGQAYVMVREYARRLPDRKRLGATTSQAESASGQMRAARLSIAARQAELLLRDTVRELCRLRNESRPEDRARWSAQIATAMHQGRSVVAEVCGMSGAGAHQLSDPMQRARRDAEVMGTHVAFDLDAALETAGKAMLGLEISPLM